MNEETVNTVPDAAAAVSGDMPAAEDADAALLAAHRVALARMRASTAVDLLIDASSPRDAEVVRRLLDVDLAALAGTEDANGVPDTKAVREKLSQLKRDCGYLFCNGSQVFSPGVPATGGGHADRGGMSEDIRMTAAAPDPDSMSDADYYRTYFKR